MLFVHFSGSLLQYNWWMFGNCEVRRCLFSNCWYSFILECNTSESTRQQIAENNVICICEVFNMRTVHEYWFVWYTQDSNGASCSVTNRLRSRSRSNIAGSSVINLTVTPLDVWQNYAEIRWRLAILPIPMGICCFDPQFKLHKSLELG